MTSQDPIIGIQLYSLKDELARDMDGALAAVAAMGYTAVEFPSEPSIPAAALRDRLTALNLRNAAVVYDWPRLDRPDGLSTAIDYALTSRAAYVMFPWIPKDRRSDADGWRRATEQMQVWADGFSAAGVPFLYHFHGYEFAPIGDTGLTGEEILRNYSNPQTLLYQLDTFWALFGGCDPVDFLRRYGARIRSLHCKDMNNPAEHHDVPVGSGCIEWKTILPLARSLNIDWFIVEQEQFDAPVFEALAVCRRQLAELLANSSR
jgi:sugar phosphate isomerase/epimerase